MRFPRRFSFLVFVSVIILVAAPAVFASSVPASSANGNHPATAARSVAAPTPNVRAASSVVFEQDPSTGGDGGCWQNEESNQNYADRATLSTDTVVTEISIWACQNLTTTVHVQILADSSGVPGSVLYSEDATPTVVADGSYYKYTVQLATPFLARGGTQYWYGISGSGTTDIGIHTLRSTAPDDGQSAEFIGSSYDHMSGVGDQSFELVGHAAAKVPAVGLSGLVALALLLALGGVLALKR